MSSDTPDISVVITFHSEGMLAIPALASMRELVAAARQAGLAVEARAVLDKCNSETRHYVAVNGDWLDGVEEISLGHAAWARNAGVQATHGRYIAFIDGDDLWGADWLLRAFRAASEFKGRGEAIWHPDYLFFFTAADFDISSITDVPHPGAQSYFRRHSSSLDEDFVDEGLLFANHWSANAFALRDVHLRYPYRIAQDGFGIEDWSWNLETLSEAIEHLVVPDTVHIIRMKDAGSFGRQEFAKGLLPYRFVRSKPASTLGTSKRTDR